MGGCMKSHQMITLFVISLVLIGCTQTQKVVEPVKITSTSTETPQATRTFTLAPTATIPAPTDTVTP